MIRSLLIATAVVAFSCVASAPVSAQFGQGNSANPLFQQSTSNGAAMYPAPHWSPQLGAESYYTYQPLMPHEMMYQHSRNYYNYYNTGGYMGGNNSLNKTTVRWQSGSNHMGPLPFSTGLDSLMYKINKKKYCIDDGTGNCSGGGIGSRVGGHFGGGHFGGGQLRGRLHHGASIGGGCSGGDCGGEVLSDYSGDVYGGGEVVDSGCSTCQGGRARNLLHHR